MSIRTPEELIAQVPKSGLEVIQWLEWRMMADACWMCGCGHGP